MSEPQAQTTNERLDHEFKSKWVGALRSGKYKQRMGLLRGGPCMEDGFCCLGVALDLIDPNGWTGIGQQEWKGLGATNILGTAPVIGVTKEEARRLAGMNDGHLYQKLTFAEIADYIESNL